MKKVEKHITVLEDTFKKLKEIAEAERRSMRTVVTKMIDDKHKEMEK